jgi:hypothetical protein
MNLSAITNFIVKYKKEIIIFIIVLILLVVIKRNWYKVKKFLNPQGEDNIPASLQDPNSQGGMSEARKIYIESITSEIYDDIESTPWSGHDYEPYNQATALYDDELKHMGNYYFNHLTKGKESMSDAIDSQYYTWDSGTVADLKTKLISYDL